MVLVQETAEVPLDEATLLALGIVLVLAALAWLVVRLSARVRALEASVDSLLPLAELPASIEALAADLQGRDLHERLRAQLAESAEAQVRLAGRVDDLGGRIDQQGKLVRDWGATLQAAASKGADVPLEDISIVAARHLRERGFEAVRLLTERSHVEGRSGSLAFEARRDGVMHKGHVVLADGVVRKESVRAAYSAFP